MYIIDIINLWLVGLKNFETITAVVAQLISPHNPVLRISYNKDWKSTLLFGNFYFYHSTQYKWADRRSNSWGMNDILINHKHS